MVRLTLLLLLLSGCAAPITFSAPARICILGNGGVSDWGCADLVPILDSLETPEMTKALCAAGAETPACKK